MWPSLCSDANASPAAIPGQAKTGRLHSFVMQRGARKREASGKAVVGVIADTHGLLRPEAVAALASVDLIVHAGDIGSAAIQLWLPPPHWAPWVGRPPAGAAVTHGVAAAAHGVRATNQTAARAAPPLVQSRARTAPPPTHAHDILPDAAGPELLLMSGARR